MACVDPARCFCSRFATLEERELHHAISLDEILEGFSEPQYIHAIKSAVKLGARAPGALDLPLHGPTRNLGE